MELMHADLLFLSYNSSFNQYLFTVISSQCFHNLELKWTDQNTYYKVLDLYSSICVHLTDCDKKRYGNVSVSD